MKLFTSHLILVSFFSLCFIAGANAGDDWIFTKKAALSYLLLQPDKPSELLNLGFQNEQVDKLISCAIEERESLLELFEWSSEWINNKNLSLARKKNLTLKHDFNEKVERSLEKSLENIKSALGKEKSEVFIAWVQREWMYDSQRFGNASPQVAGFGQDELTYTVFATQYFGETNYEVAVPDWCLKFANRGWSHESGYERSDYSLKLKRNSYTIPSVLIWDCGPWNIDDNYWNPASGHPRPRRLFKDLPQGMPEAQAAYYNGYNGGKDQYGRTVTIPTALDMTPAVAADLGLAYLQNDWVTVSFLWESGQGEIIVDDSDPGCELLGPPQNWYEASGLGYNNQMHYTYSTPTGYENAAVWSLNVPSAGNYELSVFIPRNYSTTERAPYYGSAGKGWKLLGYVNQNIYYDQWVVLKTAHLPKKTVKVAVTDGTGEPLGSKMIGVDAVKIVPK